MTEEKFEEFVKKAAQSYNVPPARTPREEMWTAIQAQRTSKPRVIYGGVSGATSSRPLFGSRVWLGAAAAGLVLIAAGVGIGRWSARPASNAAVMQAQPQTVTANPQPATPAAGNPPPQPGSVLPQVATGTARSGVSAGPVASTGAASSGSRSVALSAPFVSTPTSAYQIAAMHHLSDAEALLTSFRTRSAADQQVDAQLASWARDLLSNTRLLLDSPVASDPQRRPLLEDLELVLVQIVQLSPGSTPQDRELIEKTLQQEHVLTRLRTAIPAGGQRGS